MSRRRVVKIFCSTLFICYFVFCFLDIINKSTSRILVTEKELNFENFKTTKGPTTSAMTTKTDYRGTICPVYGQRPVRQFLYHALHKTASAQIRSILSDFCQNNSLVCFIPSELCIKPKYKLWLCMTRDHSLMT